jgi:hypothetical protein
MRIVIVALVVVAAVVGVVLWLVLGHNTKKHHQGPITTAIGPLALTENKLLVRALAIGQPMYWAGPKQNVRYEFRRLTNDKIYVRYLPKGVGVGKDCGKCLTIATYPFSNAYNALKKVTNNRGVSGPHGSYIWQNRKDPRSVLIAWPKVPYQVEVYAYRATTSAQLAESGQIHTVG